MVKRLKIFLLFAFILAAIVYAQVVVYTKKYNLYEITFREPVEKVLIQTLNGDCYEITNFCEYGIAGFYQRLDKEKIKVEDIILVVHNHIIPVRFTEKNNQAFHWLKAQGFRGRFGIYYSFNHRVIWKEDEK